MSDSPFTPHHSSTHPQSAHQPLSWSWDDGLSDTLSPPGPSQQPMPPLTLPPLHTDNSAVVEHSASLNNRSSFLAHILNGADDASDSRRTSSHYVDLTREQTPPISQERSTLRTLHHQPSTPTTPEPPSPTMPPTRPPKRDNTDSPLTSGPSTKRARRSDGSSRRGSAQDDEIEQIDLLDDDAPLATALQKQRAEQIKAQQESQHGADAPPRLSTLTCVICMDTPTDLTATACGHIFCHSCLMEALIAGEARAAPGEPRRSQCPVCRKALSRTKTGDIIPLLLMKKGLATQPRRQKAATQTPA